MITEAEEPIQNESPKSEPPKPKRKRTRKSTVTKKITPTTGEETNYTDVFNSIKTQITSLKTSVDDGFSSIDKEINFIEKELDTLKTSFKSDKTVIVSKLDEDIKVFEDDMKTIKSELRTLKKKVSVLETNAITVPIGLEATNTISTSIESNIFETLDDPSDPSDPLPDAVPSDLLEKPVDIVNMTSPKKKSKDPGMGLDFAFLFVLFSLLPIVGYYLFGQ